jgi:hypothetical protein
MPSQRNEFLGYNRDVGFDTYLIYDVSNRLQYACFALPGIATSATGWQIFRLTYDGTSTRVVTKRYADGTDAFDKIADSYSTYNYI